MKGQIKIEDIERKTKLKLARKQYAILNEKAKYLRNQFHTKSGCKDSDLWADIQKLNKKRKSNLYYREVIAPKLELEQNSTPDMSRIK